MNTALQTTEQVPALNDISPIDFNLDDKTIAEIKKKCTALKVVDNASLEILKGNERTVRELRIAVDKRRVVLKKPALERCADIEVEAKRLTFLLLEIETPLKEERKGFEAKKAAEKAERERMEKERTDAIVKKIEEIKNFPLTLIGDDLETMQSKLEGIKSFDISEELFAEYIDAAEIAYKDVVEKVEEIIAEKLEAIAEHERQQAEQKKTEEANRKAAKDIAAKEKKLEAANKKAKVKSDKAAKDLAEREAKLAKREAAIEKEEERVEAEATPEPEPIAEVAEVETTNESGVHYLIEYYVRKYKTLEVDTNDKDYACEQVRLLCEDEGVDYEITKVMQVEK